MSKKISIILSAYNGEKYIESQLISLAEQDLKADEVIIRDDGSKDLTVKIVKGFMMKNNLQWKIIEGENIGWRESFHELMKNATGDIIFFCDQDDIWHPDKLRRMSEIIENNQTIHALISYCDFIFEDSFLDKDSFLERMSGRTYDNSVWKVSENEYNNVRIGCCMAITKEFRDLCLEYWIDNFIPGHDGIVWKLGILTQSLYTYNACLIDYRKHGESAIISERKNQLNYREKARKKAELLKMEAELIQHFLSNNLNNFMEDVNSYSIKEVLIRNKVVNGDFFSIPSAIKDYHSSKNLIKDTATRVLK